MSLFHLRMCAFKGSENPPFFVAADRGIFGGRGLEWLFLPRVTLLVIVRYPLFRRYFVHLPIAYTGVRPARLAPRMLPT